MESCVYLKVMLERGKIVSVEAEKYGRNGKFRDTGFESDFMI